MCARVCVGVCSHTPKGETVAQGQKNSLYMWTLCNSIWEMPYACVCVCFRVLVCVCVCACTRSPTHKSWLCSFQARIAVLKSSLHARCSLADCVYNLQVISVSCSRKQKCSRFFFFSFNPSAFLQEDKFIAKS